MNDDKKTFEIDIADLGSQGDGIAHKDGESLFISGALPSERVRVTQETLKLKGKHPTTITTLDEVLEKSPHRIEPPCENFPACGGCRMQHVDEDFYQKWKLKRLTHDLAREGLSDLPLSPLLSIPIQTRRRARFTVKHAPQGIKIGFNGWRSHKIIDIESCTVLLPEMVSFVKKLRDNLDRWLPLHATCNIQITYVNENFDVVLIGGVPLNLDSRQDLAMIAEELDIAQLSWQLKDRQPIEPIAHRKQIILTYGETPIIFPPGSFLQATTESEQIMIALAQKWMGESESMLDLFSGLGGFGLSMTKAHKVTFADNDGLANRSLEQAIKNSNTHTVQTRNLIAEPFLASECNEFKTVLFDPPRGGARAQAAEIADSNAEKIIAISCDPASFARDARILIEKGGYKIKEMVPIDQFLWSYHLEIAALLTR